MYDIFSPVSNKLSVFEKAEMFLDDYLNIQFIRLLANIYKDIGRLREQTQDFANPCPCQPTFSPCNSISLNPFPRFVQLYIPPPLLPPNAQSMHLNFGRPF